jgi:hypothetical protein
MKQFESAIATTTNDSNPVHGLALNEGVWYFEMITWNEAPILFRRFEHDPNGPRLARTGRPHIQNRSYGTAAF